MVAYRSRAFREVTSIPQSLYSPTGLLRSGGGRDLSVASSDKDVAADEMICGEWEGLLPGKFGMECPLGSP